MGRHNTKNLHARQPNVLYGFHSLYLHEHLPLILQAKPFSFRRNSQTLKGLPGSLYPDGTPKLFTYEIAYELGVDRTGPKELVLRRLRDFFIHNQSKIPPCVAEKLNETHIQLCKKYDQHLVENFNANLARSSIGANESPQQQEQNNKNAIDGTPLILLFNYQIALTKQVQPTSENFYSQVFPRQQFTKTNLESTLATFNTEPWNCGDDFYINGSPPELFLSNFPIQLRSLSCPLRLFALLLVDSKYCKQLLYTSANQKDDGDGSTVNDIDKLDTDRTSFWKDVCDAFKTDTYRIPNVPVEDPVFLDPISKANYNISKCNSKWVTPEQLKTWYGTTHMLLVEAKRSFFRDDATGKSKNDGVDLKTLDGIRAFIETIYQPHLIQMVLLAWWRWKTDEIIGDWFATPSIVPSSPSAPPIADGTIRNPETDDYVIVKMAQPQEESSVDEQTRRNGTEVSSINSGNNKNLAESAAASLASLARDKSSTNNVQNQNRIYHHHYDVSTGRSSSRRSAAFLSSSTHFATQATAGGATMAATASVNGEGEKESSEYHNQDHHHTLLHNKFKRAAEYFEMSQKILDDTSKRRKRLQILSYKMIDDVIEHECSQLGITVNDLDHRQNDDGVQNEEEEVDQPDGRQTQNQQQRPQQIQQSLTVDGQINRNVFEIFTDN